MLAECWFAATKAVAKKFVKFLAHPPRPMEEFRLVLAGLQGKVYLIEVKNIHLSGSEYPFQGYLTAKHG